MNPTLRIFDDDPGRVAELQNALAVCGGIEVFELQGGQPFFYNAPCDAFFLTLSLAAKWGALPMVHSAQILQTGTEDRSLGAPPYVVTGTVLAPDDPKNPEFEVELLLRTALDAVNEFNRENYDAIHSIGVWAPTLTYRLSIGQTCKIILRVFDTRFNSVKRFSEFL